MWFFGLFVAAECLLLAAMAYDRYAAVSCADTSVNKWVLFIFTGAIGVLSGLIIMVSYVCILVAISRVQTAEGWWKAFSTCSSHLAAVTILYGTLFFIYVRPGSSSSLESSQYRTPKSLDSSPDFSSYSYH
ncbi:hypothetical protein GHT09_011192 [Marmota monax]|uniref:G-protein coupled receptors family 1 profile domain-containing protein n=1 Tax=Marmota monax TaxID=9995 RepID=A0A834QFU6_MARMO|nr:hypothetical protein GHT09_011192 [Marmota monax]